MKKLLLIVGVLIFVSHAWADTALVQLGPDGRPLVLPIPGNATPPVVTIAPNPPTPPTAKSATDVGTLPPAWPQGYTYVTLPGRINLVTPWSAAILAEGYDFVGKEEISQGYVPLVQWWKLTGVIGAGINGKGEGSPMGGAIVDLATVPVSNTVDFHVAVTGGYNLNEKHALAVLSGSVQFLK